MCVCGVYGVSCVRVCVHAQEMFARIRPSELLFGNAGKKNKHQLAPHVMQLVNWFNRIVNWVASVIVVNPNIKERRLVVKRFLEIADVPHPPTIHGALRAVP